MQLVADEEDKAEVFSVRMIFEDVLMSVHNEAYFALFNFVIIDDELVWNEDVSFLRPDVPFCRNSYESS